MTKFQFVDLDSLRFYSCGVKFQFLCICPDTTRMHFLKPVYFNMQHINNIY